MVGFVVIAEEQVRFLSGLLETFMTHTELVKAWFEIKLIELGIAFVIMLIATIVLSFIYWKPK